MVADNIAIISNRLLFKLGYLFSFVLRIFFDNIVKSVDMKTPVFYLLIRLSSLQVPELIIEGVVALLLESFDDSVQVLF